MHRALLFLILTVLPATAQLNFLNSGQPVLDAHNCYPYEGQWTDRLQRALSTGRPVGIEQDLAWFRGRLVVSHTPKTTGSEPLLRDYFFEAVRPIVERALADNDRTHWPLIIVHFDVKDNQPALLHAVWDLLGEYQSWITTAQRGASDTLLQPFDVKPLLVLTEDDDAQEKVFFRDVPASGRLRLFGSAHTTRAEGATPEERDHLAATLSPEKLLTTPPTNYRRWWNNSWHEVEEGGQPKAGGWTDADQRRLRALVDHAHKLGYWIRFYTLDGFAPADSRGWDAGYNFGSAAAVRLRWQAALEAGVDLIATDQYEDLAAFMAR